MKRIFLVEDCLDTQTLVRNELKAWFEVICARTIEEAIGIIKRENFDLILIDLGLPDGSGFQLCTKIKSHPQSKEVPIIFLTASTDPILKVMGFSLGADDYVTKPFSAVELRARIEARMRKPDGPISSVEEVQWFGDLRFDRIKLRVYAEERDLCLTPIEFKLLYYLASQEGKTLSRPELLKGISESNVFVNDENIYTHISSIRKKMGTRGVCLENVPRLGYRFKGVPRAEAGGAKASDS